MADNVSMSATAKFIHNTTESTESPTQVTTHTKNIMDTYTKNNYEEGNGVDRGDYDGYDTSSSPKDLSLDCGSRQVESSIRSLFGTTDDPPTHPLAREINVNGAAFQSKKIMCDMCD